MEVVENEDMNLNFVFLKVSFWGKVYTFTTKLFWHWHILEVKLNQISLNLVYVMIISLKFFFFFILLFS